METSEIKRDYFDTNYFHLSKAFCNKGISHAGEGRFKEALENFNKAIKVNPNNYIAYFYSAKIKIDLGDIEGAKTDFLSFDILRK